MKRFLLVLLLVAAPAFAAQQYYSAVSATQSNSTVSFGFVARYVLVINDDATNEVFVDFSDGTAAVTDFELKAGESVSIPPMGGSVSQLGLICSSGETATVRVLALR